MMGLSANATLDTLEMRLSANRFAPKAAYMVIAWSQKNAIAISAMLETAVSKNATVMAILTA